MFEEMLNFNCSVKCQSREFLMHSAHNTEGVGWSIPEIGISKGNVLCPTLDLSTNVGQDNVGGDSEETTSINRGNGTMSAGVFTATCCFGVPRRPTFTVPL